MAQNIDKAASFMEMQGSVLVADILDNKGKTSQSSFDLDKIFSKNDDNGLWAGTSEKGFYDHTTHCVVRKSAPENGWVMEVNWKNGTKTTMVLHSFLQIKDGKLVQTPSYVTQCGHIKLEDGHFLYAQVPQGKAGTTKECVLDLNEFVGIENGQFVWGEPKADFKKTAGLTEVKLKNAITLTAKLNGKKIKLNLSQKVLVRDHKLQGLNTVVVGVKDDTLLEKFFQFVKGTYPKTTVKKAVTDDGKMQLFYLETNVGSDGNFLVQTSTAQAQASVLHYVNNAKFDIENVDVHILSAKAGVTLGADIGSHGYIPPSWTASPRFIGGELSLSLITFKSSVFEAKLGFGVSTGIGIKDDSLSFEVLGVGFTIGRKVGISVFDNEITLDFAKIFTTTS